MGARSHTTHAERVNDDEAHVQLTCGAHVLSDAENWYLPARLTADMNRRLEETEAPFGRVVAPLGFHRRTLETRLAPARIRRRKPFEWKRKLPLKLKPVRNLGLIVRSQGEQQRAFRP